jgi:hypothetical protein
MRGIILCALMAAACATQVTASGGGQGNNQDSSSAELKLAVGGKITPRCSLSLNDNQVGVILDDRAGNASVGFSVDCNQRLALSVSTRNGGLALLASPGFVDSPGFASFQPYKLDFSIGTSGANPLSFNSEAIKSVPGSGSFGVIPFAAQGNLALSWQTNLPLIGGNYSDIIEIRVSGEGESGNP